MANRLHGPDWFDRQDWVELRKKGRQHFVWRYRVLPFGVPMGAVSVLWAFDLLGLGARDIFTRQGLALTYYCMGVYLVVTYILAQIEWVQREEKFDQRGKQD